MASQLLSAMKRTGLWAVSYFANDPSNRKEAHSGSKVDVEAPASSSSSSTPSHPISSPSQQPNFQSESQTQTHSSTFSQPHSSSSSSSTASHRISSPSQQPVQSQTQTQTHLSNPIAKAFRELEIAKSFLTFILPTTTMILALHGKDSSPGVLHSMLCLLCASLVALLYGISLRDLFPGIANASEQLGIACIYTSFFIVVASHLPSAVFWIPLVCFMASMPLSIWSCLPVKKKANTNTNTNTNTIGSMPQTPQK